MDFEALVRSVTEKVLAELRARPGFVAAPAPDVLVLATPDFAHAAALEAKLRERLGQAVRLEFYKTPGAPEVFSAAGTPGASGTSGATSKSGAADKAVPCGAFGAGPKSVRYILPYLCCPDMAALATGRATGPITRKVLDLLLAGEKVEVLEFEYPRHAAAAPQALYELYAGYAATLASFGLVKLAEKRPELLRFRADLVTEKSVREAAAAGVRKLVAPRGAKVTALAEDAARELGLEISKDGEV